MTATGHLRRAFAVGAAVALATLTIAGCGDDDDLSREAYLERANAICADGNARIAAAAPSGGGEQGPSAGEAMRFVDVLVAEGDRQIDELDAIEGPSELEAEVDTILADARQVLERIEAEGPEAFFAQPGDPFADVNAQLNELGLTECGGSD